MSLPELIEIIPPARCIKAEVTVPGSKSITNRALILAALSEGNTELKGALWSEDTQLMVEALETLGFQVEVSADPDEFCNRTIRVRGEGGKIPRAGTAEKPLDIFVGNAGTAARFLAPLVCLGQGIYRLHGVPRMHERPQKELFQALRKLGYAIHSPNDKLPAVIHGSGPNHGSCEVSVRESSQFASGLILCSRKAGWHITMTAEPQQPPYVHMTSELIQVFPSQGGLFQIEADASSGSYFLAADHFLPGGAYSGVSVAHWPRSGWQIDEHFPRVISSNAALNRGLELHRAQSRPRVDLAPSNLSQPDNNVISREKDLGDSIMTAIVLAPFALEPIRFTALGRLRIQESERVAALRTELAKCGARVAELGDNLEVFPSALHGAEIETYNDHRIAMCFGILGLKVPGIRIKNPSCVKKTFPNFFQKLATLPPHGLGVKIVDIEKGQELTSENLFAA